MAPCVLITRRLQFLIECGSHVVTKYFSLQMHSIIAFQRFWRTGSIIESLVSNERVIFIKHCARTLFLTYLTPPFSYIIVCSILHSKTKPTSLENIWSHMIVNKSLSSTFGRFIYWTLQDANSKQQYSFPILPTDVRLYERKYSNHGQTTLSVLQKLSFEDHQTACQLTGTGFLEEFWKAI